MSNCSDCIKINPIPACALIWEVGQVDSAYDGEVLIARITNLATGRVTIADTEPVAIDGTVTIELPEELNELMLQYYKIELLDGDLNLITLTIGEDEKCCVEFKTFQMQTDATVIFSTQECLTSS